MKRIWLRHGADMERLTLHCTDPENPLGIVGLAASSDVLRLVLSDTVALRIVGLAGSSDVLRLVLSDTVALRIVGLVASSDVLRLVRWTQSRSVSWGLPPVRTCCDWSSRTQSRSVA